MPYELEHLYDNYGNLIEDEMYDDCDKPWLVEHNTLCDQGKIKYMKTDIDDDTLRPWGKWKTLIEDCMCYCAVQHMRKHPELTNDGWAERCRKKKSADKEYRYFITWTVNPNAKIPRQSETTYDDLIEKVRSSFNNFLSRHKKLQISEVWHCEEHIDTNFHIHSYVKANECLKKSVFTNYSKWGNIDKQKAKGSDEDIEAYLGKESNIKKEKFL